jgi:hypothetical protein
MNDWMNIFMYVCMYMHVYVYMLVCVCVCVCVRGPFAKFVDWRQCAAVMQREAVSVM